MPEPDVERTPRTWVTRAERDDLDASLARIAAAGGGPVRWWATEPDEADRAAAERHRLQPERKLHQLRRPLPIDDPVPSIALRAFVPGVDERDWLTVNNRAFADHPEQGGWTRDMLLAREQEAWFDAEGFLLHHDDTGRLAGFVWTKVHPATEDDPPLGEIFVIAVDPDYSGRGLGRALTVAGLEWLHRERGLADGMLYVDAANEPAMELYAAIGFTIYRTDVAFVGTV